MSFWYDEPNRMVIYDTPYAAGLVPLLDDAVHAETILRVPATLRNMQVCTHYGLPSVPVVDLDYDWPIKAPFYPREHQKTMTNFMVLNPRSFNLSDMGTMKTLATLWACEYIMCCYAPGTCRAIVSAPLSTLQRVWGDALFKHMLGRRTFIVVNGSTHAARRKQFAQPADFYIIGHDALKQGAKLNKRRQLVLEGLSKDIIDRADIMIGVIDEVGSGFRDDASMRSKCARLNIAKKPYFWPLTGTPTPNGPEDAHGLARLLGSTNESFNQYRQRVMYKVSEFKWVPRVGATEEAYKMLQPSIRYEMRECTDVPPCTEQMRDVGLSPQQERLYKEMKRDLVLQLEQGTITAVNEAALRLKLIQICCGAIYDNTDERNVTRIDCSPRLAVLREVIEEAQRKVIIFAPLTSVLHLLYDDLKEYSRAIINGEVKVKERDKIFENFQNAQDPQIIIADPATMSHGLDLFAASVVVWYGATDRTELYLQANRRIDRPGQSVATTIVQLAATSVEREIFKRAASNTAMQGAILDMVREQ